MMLRMTRVAALATLAMLLATVAPADAGAQTSRELWPDQQGNTWTYALSGSISQGSKTITVSRRSGGWAYYDGFEGGVWLWTSAQSGHLWMWNFSTNRFTVLIPFDTPAGRTFEAASDDLSCWDEAEYRVADKSATIVTPAGTFQGCTVLELVDSRCADAGMTRMAFCPNVGLVEYGWQTIAGPQTAKLERAMVDGREYKPQPTTSFTGGVSLSAAIDQPIYFQTSNGVPTLRARLTLDNQSAREVPVTYSSGQSFDWIVRDESGNEVWRWSHNRMFTMALRMTRLAPGDKIVFEQGIELRDQAGVPLRAGEYTLEAVITTIPRRTVKIPFTVS